MAKQLIDIGSNANDNTGDSIRTGFDKVNSNLNQLFDAVSATGAATFTTPAGTFVGSPSSPVTTTISLSTTNAVNGGVCGVYFQGTSLAFSGGTVVIQTGEIVINELCVVWLIYDKTNNAFIANVQSGATGEVPPPSTIAPPTNLVLTQGEFTISGIAAPTNLVLTEGTI